MVAKYEKEIIAGLTAHQLPSTYFEGMKYMYMIWQFIKISKEKE